ncbi:DUF4345 domain-containing protein, partial [Salmonella enterica subsp. enterica serovar Typhi]|nr:DUF4345 domain-containing protein [Salmonella enterica subsp. enterica serovar Typhi]
MEFAFPWPASQGEWLAWTSAAITVAFGLLLLFAPRISFRILRLAASERHPSAIAEGRSTMAGFYLGLGLCCLLLGNQPFLYMALGASWGFTAFGRLIAMMSDGANTPYHWIVIIVDIVLAALPLLFIFGAI